LKSDWQGGKVFLDCPQLPDFAAAASRVVTQAEGSAFRIDADEMRNAVRKCPQLMVTLLRYSQEATMEVTQIVACNRLHSVEERLARWLLMSQDRIGSDKLPLT
jgi:CRP-like cAMP-binding protein